MKTNDLKAVMAELNERSDAWRYVRDGYCLQLLKYRHGSHAHIAKIKQGPFKGLLERPAMKALTAERGDGRIDLQRATVTGAVSHEFRLTYSLWRGRSKWDQVSRAGWQLVVQLNFPREHDEVYRNKVRPKKNGPFVYNGHPVRNDNVITLAWARIDLDPLCSQALIEEVQTDWLREARYIKKACRTYKGRRLERRYMKYRSEKDARLEDILAYIDEVLPPYERVWQEALLAACLWVLVEQLGYRSVYMHSYDTGRVLKNCQPPRSLYSALPRKFCMQRVDYAPGMVMTESRAKRALRTLKNPYWFQHKFDGGQHAHA